ncbi:MAG: putative quinol monooxygenase [Promethearchaeota archaeon]
MRKITITLIATVEIKAGKMEEAKEILKEIAKSVLANEPGTLEYIPHTVRKEENTIIFVEKYKDVDAMKAHMKGLGKTMAKALPLMVPAPPNIKSCTPIE